MTEVITIVVGVILSVTSVGGWIYTIRRNGRNEGKMQQQITTVVDTVGKLPCQAHSEFLEHIGGVVKSVQGLEEGQKRIEGGQVETNRRIDNIINSGTRRRKS